MKREELYVLGDGDSSTYYKSEADSVMDAMEARIKELEAENARLKAQVPKWHSVADGDLPNNGALVLVCFDERAKAHYFPTDVVRWDSSYELQEIPVTHWCELPQPPTTEDYSATEKENEAVIKQNLITEKENG